VDRSRGTVAFAPEDGVVAHALEVVEIGTADALLQDVSFSAEERAYALGKSDPARRLAARLAAKRAAVAALGGHLALSEIEVRRSPGRPPVLRLSEAAQARLLALGARELRVSLTHGETHAAAVVVAVRS
jgi:holo-[acyl-carrier protein] synthase